MPGNPLSPPLQVQRPEPVLRLPEALPGGALWQAKLDGHRTVAFIDADGVTLQARSGRIVTTRFPEVLPALAALPAGTVLDGEVVAVRDGQFEFTALAGTAASRRMRHVAVSYVAFDVLAEAGADLRRLPLSERWERLLALLDGAPAGLEPVMATTDRAQALEWLAALAPIGVEGVVGKALSGPYVPGVGHGWVKYRATDTIDGTLIAAEVASLRIRLDDGREVVTEPLTPAQVHQVAEALAEMEAGDVRVEARMGHGRHGKAAFVRLRAPE
jgi:bifunctional non-homologous end joining protein LigD